MGRVSTFGGAGWVLKKLTNGGLEVGVAGKSIGDQVVGVVVTIATDIRHIDIPICRREPIGPPPALPFS